MTTSSFTTIRFSPIRAAGTCRIPMRFGVPFSRGSVDDERLAALTARDGAGQPLAMTARPTARWSDGSVRWACASVLLNTSSAGTGLLALAWGDPSATLEAAEPAVHVVAAGADRVVLDGSETRHVFATDSEGPLFAVLAARADEADASMLIRPDIRDVDDAPMRLQGGRFEVDDSDRLRLQVRWTGLARAGRGARSLRLTLTFTMHGGHGLWSVSVTLHNPAAARHRDGRWDLGDPGSVRFRSASLRIAAPDPATVPTPMETLEVDCGGGNHVVEPNGPWSLLQASSGGEQWQSPVHVDADRQVLLPFRGYQLIDSGTLAEQGERAQPCVRVRCGGTAASISMPRFWQNFPSAISAERDTFRLSWFAETPAGPHELQGGEQKTRDIWFDTTERPDLRWTYAPPMPLLDPDYLAATRAAPLFSTLPHSDPLESLVQGGADGPHSFFQKRERIDEFGWRHFGDLYADHEHLNYPGELPLVSHYNNQYDPLESFWRQATRCGDPAWMMLAYDLVDHVVDIDIYRTERDRAVFNGGLFWHTDHYVHAHTATHRTYSKYNTTSCDGEAGGGPGSEHCYTAGLSSMYWLTGDVRYRDAALIVIEWITRVHEGNNGLLEWLDEALRKELPKFVATLRGRRVPAFRYPLTRGTGNYVNALIDGYLLTGDAQYLGRADRVVRATLHPSEVVAERDLLDAEYRWSYLVLLQALCRFVAVLRDDDIDADAACYAEACLVHFSDWMVDHERVFLDVPEILDFPNETWSAQDMRKASIFSAAAALQPEQAARYEARIREFEVATARGLSGSLNAVHTRILVVLLQSRPADTSLLAPAAQRESDVFGAVPTWTVAAALRRSMRRLGRALRRLSPKQEWNWLRFRFRDRLPTLGGKRP